MKKFAALENFEFKKSKLQYYQYCNNYFFEFLTQVFRCLRQFQGILYNLKVCKEKLKKIQTFFRDSKKFQEIKHKLTISENKKFLREAL